MKNHAKIICAAVLGLALTLAGCGEDGGDIQAINPAQGGDAASVAAVQPGKTKDPSPGFSEDDLCFDIDGLSVRLGADINDITAVLGDNYEFFEAISCAYDGMDKTFVYSGAEFYTYPDGDKDFLFEVCLVDDSYATSAGLRVGCTEQDIKAAYGENCFMEGIVLRYNLSGNPDNMNEPSLYFVIENGKASSIGISLGEREV